MIGNMAKKALRAARGTSMFVGAVVMLAVVLGVGTTALAAKGKPFILGKNNVAAAITTLTNRGAGPALNLVVRSGQPPLSVSSSGKVANLNSDSVDGKDSTDFLAAGGKAAEANRADTATNAQNAANADTLDGKNSTDFAAASSEAWKPISASGSTPFDRFYDGWVNFDGTHSRRLITRTRKVSSISRGS